MIQAGQQLDFTQETSGKFFASGEIGQEDFHGLDAVGNRVADFVDAAHSAGAQFAENFVVANSLDFFAHMELPGRVGRGCRDSSVKNGTGAETWPQSSRPRLCSAFRGGATRVLPTGGPPTWGENINCYFVRDQALPG